jgi:hypothetical protein
MDQFSVFPIAAVTSNFQNPSYTWPYPTALTTDMLFEDTKRRTKPNNPVITIPSSEPFRIYVSNVVTWLTDFVLYDKIYILRTL